MSLSNTKFSRSSLENSSRRQSLAPFVLTALLSLALIVLGYGIYRQLTAAGIAFQTSFTSLQGLWPFTIENLSLSLQPNILTLLWIALAISWLTSLTALVINRFNQTLMLILMGTALFSIFLFIPLIFSGIVLLSDLLLLFLVGLAGNLLFNERITARYMTLAIGFGMIALILDIFVPWQRPQPITGDVLYVFYGALLAAFTIVIALGFQRYPLRQKLIFIVMLVSIISIVVVVFVAVNNVDNTIQSTANQALLIAASQTIASVEGFINNAIITLETEAHNGAYIDYLSLSADERTEELALNVDLGLFKLLSKRTSTTQEALSHLRFLQGVSLLDSRGEVVRDTQGQNIGQSLVNDAVFLNALRGKGAYISSVQFGLEDMPLIFISTQVNASDGSTIGVFIMRYDGNLFQQLISESNNLAGIGSYAILADSKYFIQLANGFYPDQRFRTPLPLTDQLVEEIQAQNIVPGTFGTTISSNQAELVRGLKQAQLAWENYIQAQEAASAQLAELSMEQTGNAQILIDEELRNLRQDLSFTFPDPYTNKTFLASYSGMKLVPWVIIYSQSEDYFLEPLRMQVQNIQLLAMVVVLGAAGLAFVLSQLLAAPISSLTKVAGGIASGDFSQKVPVQADDEIGKLAVTFNSMAEQLSMTMVSLEKRVEERTADLTRRSAQMQAAVEVGRAAANLRNIIELLPQVCQLISERFGFYHVGIFLIDPSGSYAVLRAANSEGGQRMLARTHRLEVGQQGIVGYVTATGQPRIALDVGEDAVYFDNPDLPQTRSEAALPLQSGGRIIGALDVQSTEPGAFSPDDIVVLRVMADLVATAIENARLFEDSQQALDISRRVYGEISRQGWSDVFRSKTSYGYRDTERGLFLVQDNLDASRSEEVAEQQYSLSIPIWVRNSIVGYLKTKKPLERGPWTDEEVESVAKVVEQLNVALESARLYQSSQVQAQRERLITEITSRMRENLDVDAVLQVAVKQIFQALELQKVSVALGADIVSGLEEPVE